MERRRISAFVVCALGLTLAGCSRKTPPTEPRPIPAVDVFSVEPLEIERGQPVVVKWSVRDATTIRIEPTLGTVEPAGERRVFPAAPTNYTLSAKGPGGERTATAFRVRVRSAFRAQDRRPGQ
jgi:hypothetical protein